MTYYLIQASKVMIDSYPNKGQLDTVIGTRNYINNHFDKELNLDFLSKVRCTSKFHLIRLFKKYYGQTPKTVKIAVFNDTFGNNIQIMEML
jgi:AraC-like DNA-binding protein